MRGSNWLLALGCGLLLSASGCCGYQCGGGCGGGCNECGTCAGGGPIYGRRPLSQAACGEDCCSGPCDNCGCDDGCQRNFCFHPFRWIGGLFYSNTWCGSCGGGCGCGNGCDGGYASQGAGGYSGGSSGGYSEGYSGYASGRPGCKNCNRGAGLRRRRHVGGAGRRGDARRGLAESHARATAEDLAADLSVDTIQLSRQRRELLGGRPARGKRFPRAEFFYNW